MQAQPVTPVEPWVADTIIFASSPLEAKAQADALGIPFDEVQWYRSADLLGNVDVSESRIVYTPAFTHRADYANTRDRVKQKTGVGRRGNPKTAGRTAV